MFRRTCVALGAVIVLGAGAGADNAHAQLAVSVLAGAYVPGSDFYSLRDEADARRIERSSTLGLGVNLDIGALRLGAVYATGATLNDEGVDNGDRIGDGTVLGAAAALVLRPMPRLVAVQPYLLGGLGLKREHFSFDDDAPGNPLPRTQSDLGLQIGIGADLMLLGVGIVAEITDYITLRDGSLGQHDAFVLLGLRIGL